MEELGKMQAWCEARDFVFLTSTQMLLCCWATTTPWVARFQSTGLPCIGLTWSRVVSWGWGQDLRCLGVSGATFPSTLPRTFVGSQVQWLSVHEHEWKIYSQRGFIPLFLLLGRELVYVTDLLMTKTLSGREGCLCVANNLVSILVLFGPLCHWFVRLLTGHEKSPCEGQEYRDEGVAHRVQIEGAVGLQVPGGRSLIPRESPSLSLVLCAYLPHLIPNLLSGFPHN
jgi:hypothetical protein